VLRDLLDADLRQSAAEELRRVGAPAAPRLLAFIRAHAASEPPAAAAAARVLARLGVTANSVYYDLEALCRDLGQPYMVVADGRERWQISPDPPSIRARGTELVDELLVATVAVDGGAGTTLRELEAALDAANPLVCEAALIALADHGVAARELAPKVVALADSRKGDCEIKEPFPMQLRHRPRLRELALEALIAIDPTNPVTASGYIARLRHRDPIVRAETIAALARLRDSAACAVTFVSDGLLDPDVRVVREAVTALGQMGKAARTVRNRIEHALSHPDAQVVARARATLAQLDALGEEDKR